MTKFSLNSHHKSFRFFLYFCFFTLLLVVLIDIFCSIILNNNLKEVRKITTGTKEFSFSYKFAYFDLFRGAIVSNLEFDKGGEILFAAKRLDIGFDLFSLLKGQVLVKNIVLARSRVSLEKVNDMTYLTKEIIEKMQAPMYFYETTHFKGTDLECGNAVLGDVRGYFSLIKGNLLISRGDFLLKKINVAALPDVDILEGSNFYKPFDYVFEGEFIDKDFAITRFEMSNPYLKFTASGRVKDIGSNPDITFSMHFLNIVLDDFPAFNNKDVQSRGVLDAVLNATGTPADLKSTLSVKASNAEFSFVNSLFLTKINGSILFIHDRLVGQDISFLINGRPFEVDMAIYHATFPHILLQLSSLSKDAATGALILNLSADWVDNELVGNMKTKIRYLLQDTAHTVDFRLKNFRFGRDDHPFMLAENLDIEFVSESIEPHPKTEVFKRSFSLEQLFCIVRRQKDGFLLEDVNAISYSGTAEGQINFSTAGGKLGVEAEAHVRDIDLSEFFQNTKDASYVLLGKLDADVKFDNRLSEILKGQIFIKNGMVEEVPLLNAVADFLGVKSLKKISFEELSMFFSGGRGEYNSEARLKSSLVNVSLDADISSYDKIDGYLTATLATELLNESKNFKKILKYIRHGEPSVTFPFKISSYIHSPRVLWLKNEFKEKLQNLLPESNKRLLQRQVTGMVENMKAE